MLRVDHAIGRSPAHTQPADQCRGHRPEQDLARRGDRIDELRIPPIRGGALDSFAVAVVIHGVGADDRSSPRSRCVGSVPGLSAQGHGLALDDLALDPPANSWRSLRSTFASLIVVCCSRVLPRARRPRLSHSSRRLVRLSVAAAFVWPHYWLLIATAGSKPSTETLSRRRQ